MIVNKPNKNLPEVRFRHVEAGTVFTVTGEDFWLKTKMQSGVRFRDGVIFDFSPDALCTKVNAQVNIIE